MFDRFFHPSFCLHRLKMNIYFYSCYTFIRSWNTFFCLKKIYCVFLIITVLRKEDKDMQISVNQPWRK